MHRHLLATLVTAAATLVATCFAAQPAAADTIKDLTIARTDTAIVITGQQVSFAGTAPDTVWGGTLKLQRRTSPTAKWVTVASPVISTGGRWSGSGPAGTAGVNYWRVVISSEGERHVSPKLRTDVYRWYYLSQLDYVDQERFDEGSDVIGGTSYSRSVFNAVDFWWNHEPYREWNLGYRCATFQASIGLSDESDSEGVVGFRATVDGADTEFGSKSIGAATPVSLDLSAHLRLRLTDVYVSGPASSGNGHFWGVWGNAKILCAGSPN